MAVERRWVRRLSARFTLLNQATAGAGNPGVGRVKWTEESLGRLGRVPDSELALELGCERKTVSYRREVMGIAASFDRKNNTPPPSMGGWNRVDLGAEIVALLGTAPDHEIARRAGVSKKRIMKERHARELPSYAERTGFDGRIKVGEPHRRWNR